MAITLSDGVITVSLDPDLLWIDEHSWHPVEQSVERSITGALVIDIGTRIGGRPITLQPENDGSAWMTAAELTQLSSWAAVAGQELQLTLRGITRAVLFRHSDTAFEAVPVVHYRDVVGEDWYLVTFRFLEI